jgi:hypothetical protein
MTKDDWTILFVRLVGLYLLVTHLATFATTTAGLILALTQNPRGPNTLYIWQSPVVSLIVLLVAIFLITKAATINRILQKYDRN